jgi:hypothetical protein
MTRSPSHHVQHRLRRKPTFGAWIGGFAVLLGMIGSPVSAAGANPKPAGALKGTIGQLLAVMPNPYLSLGYGASVATSGHTAVVDNSIYTRGLGGWPATPSATLNESGEVAISGSTIVVGSSEAGSSQRGQAYIYVRSRKGWPSTPTDVLDDPGASAGDGFGATVAISGSTLVVGDLFSPSNDNVGKAYVFVRGSSGWTASPIAVLSPPPGDHFRDALALSGHTAIIGGVSASQNANVAFIYTEGRDGWPASPTGVLDDPTMDPTDCFGEAVGISDVAATVGDWCTSSGRAYIYEKDAEGWRSLPGTVLSPLPGRSRELSEFGLAISMSGETIIVGAPGTDTDTGEVFIYRKGNAGFWPSVPNASLPDPAATLGDTFGVSLAVSGGVAIVGAPGTPVNQSASGAGYLFGA